MDAIVTKTADIVGRAPMPVKSCTAGHYIVVDLVSKVIAYETIASEAYTVKIEVGVGCRLVSVIILSSSHCTISRVSKCPCDI